MAYFYLNYLVQIFHALTLLSVSFLCSSGISKSSGDISILSASRINCCSFVNKSLLMSVDIVWRIQPGIYHNSFSSKKWKQNTIYVQHNGEWPGGYKELIWGKRRSWPWQNEDCETYNLFLSILFSSVRSSIVYQGLIEIRSSAATHFFKIFKFFWF